MAQPNLARNPFMLMTDPEVVLAAIENSEHLGRLTRHLCRPLDRPLIGARPGTSLGGAPEDATAAEFAEGDPADGDELDDAPGDNPV